MQVAMFMSSFKEVGRSKPASPYLLQPARPYEEVAIRALLFQANLEGQGMELDGKLADCGVALVKVEKRRMGRQGMARFLKDSPESTTGFGVTIIAWRKRKMET